MLRYGTKDRYERETEESDRLVRPAPKVKPPRNDRRRETIETEADPDLSQKDPDLSNNYKDVGGSIGARVVRRWLDRNAADGEKLVRVRHKDTGRVTYVTPDTLRENVGKYEVAEEDSSDTPSEAEPSNKETAAPTKSTPSKEEDAPSKSEDEGQKVHLYQQIHEAIRDDPAFESLAKSIADPKVSIGQLPNDFPLDKLKGFVEKFPLLKSFKTMGDARQAIHGAKNLKQEKKKEKKRERGKPSDVKQKALEDAGEQIREKAKNDPALQTVVEQVDGDNPRALVHLRHQMDPSEDASAVIPGLPSNVHTLGEVVDALKATRPGKDRETPKSESDNHEPSEPSEDSGVEESKEKESPASEPIKEPTRRKTTQEESDRAQRQIIENFPVEVAESLLDADPPVHPDDVRDLVEIYHTAKSNGKDEELTKLVQKGGYTTDPWKVRPPAVGVNSSGDEVPFDQLTGEEKGNALRKHQMFVLAMSLAARERTVATFKKKSKAPEELLGSIADFTLHHVPNETAEDRAIRAAGDAKRIFSDAVKRGLMAEDTDRYARWQAEKDKSPQKQPKGFEYGEKGEEGDEELPPPPAPEGLDEGQVRKALDLLKNDPATQYLVVGYGQAGDYLRAQHEFLNPDSSKAISEHQSPRDIVKGLQRLDKFFDEANEKYPEEMRNGISGKNNLRNLILDKVRTIAPDKFPFVKKYIQEQEFDDYEGSLKEWKKQYTKYQKDLKKHQQKNKGKDPYRSNADGPVLPEPPVRPEGYLQSRGSKEEREQRGEEILDKFRRSVGVEDADKTASMIWRVFHRFSSCRPNKSMGPGSKEGVYWGVEPYSSGHEVFAPYPGWQQARTQSLMESDLAKILATARSWLRAPMLSEAVDGIYRDTQLRAALDLSIRSCEDGRYSEGVHPTLYNRLLARLGGTPEGDTLLTDRESLYASGDTRPMKHSHQVRALAARVASENPHLAYDLIEMAARFAQDEQQGQGQQGQEQKQGGEVPPQFLEHQKKKEDEGQGQGQQEQKQAAAAYQALRSVVIKMAHANPALRDAYRPILETIQKIG